MIDKKQYLDILENDPHDFNALRGLLCAEFRWDSFDQVKDLDRLGRTVSKEDCIAKLREQALNEDKLFFDIFADVYQLSKRYVELTDKVDTCEKDVKRRTSQTAGAESSTGAAGTSEPYGENNGNTGYISEKMAGPSVIVFLGGLFLLMFLTLLFKVTGALIGTVIFLAGIIWLCLLNAKVSKQFHEEKAKNIENNKKRLEESKEDLKQTKSEFNVLRTELLRKVEWLVFYRC